MPVFRDGAASRLFSPLPFSGNAHPEKLPKDRVSEGMAKAAASSPSGASVAHGIPFQIRRAAVAGREPVTVKFRRTKAPWLVFLHVADVVELERNSSGFIRTSKGYGQLGERAADYEILRADGTSETVPIRRRFEIGAYGGPWGENCFEAVRAAKPRSVRAHHEQMIPGWGFSQTRAASGTNWRFQPWLWAWKNPKPGIAIIGVGIRPASGPVVLLGVSAGKVSHHPLRWETRKKMLWRLPKGMKFQSDLDGVGNLSQVRIDLGQIIHAEPRALYPDREWESSLTLSGAPGSEKEILIEYTAHPQARFHLPGGKTVPVGRSQASEIATVPPSRQRVELKVVERAGGKSVPVKLHVHGPAGQYLAPVDRHRYPNPSWFEDYSADVVHNWSHNSTYITGETALDLPRGEVFIEITRGFEVKPKRMRVRVGSATRKITIQLDRVLNWRAKGWVTADTHVHFLSPVTGILEGAGEGVNVVNLLASQWGELMTNVGDFDGKTTWGARGNGSDGEHLVRVGTENRQHVLGHISLLGYRGRIIAPMTTAGPDESALGDPVEILLSEWAEKCRKQGGLVVVPHFPNPRAEHAAALVLERVDGIEMTSWGNLYGGLDPYALSDWYRYLNCGYLVPAVGGTDKMSAVTPVGTVRTYARLKSGERFTYEAWVRAVRRAETFVSYGPLIDFSVEGRPAGSCFKLKNSGGTLDVAWKVASVTTPMTKVELVVNGETRESVEVEAGRGSGVFRLACGKSCWAAILVRGRYKGKHEIIAAHSSPVMVEVDGTTLLAAADADTILEQIEGSLAFVETIGTRAETKAYRRMRALLLGAHRRLHNRLHARGVFHHHGPLTEHGN